MGTNYYIINKAEAAEKSSVNQKIQELTTETIEKLSAIRELEKQDRVALELKIKEFELPVEKTHIGRSAYGWRFTFHKDMKSFKNFREVFDPETMVIIDEYDREVPLENMTIIIEASLKNPPRDRNGKEIAHEDTGNHYLRINEEGFYVSSGDFS